MPLTHQHTMTASSPPLSVAVIGAGPAGMFFCHALETYRRELRKNGDEAALANLPVVTCFERAPAPGGVWRSERTFAENKDEEDNDEDVQKAQSRPVETTNMYEALWLNGCKEPIEFFDYTYDEHFQKALPPYLPREMFLEYMLARVTKHCPTFCDDYIQCNTSVLSVKYKNATKKFEIVTKNHVTNQVTTGFYDKCIWAAGQNGKPKLPKDLISMFRLGGFRGRMIHSTDTANFEEDVKGKRVLLIGGSYSAEDLALMAVKCGAEKIYICSRSAANVVTWTTAWPMDKVEVLTNQAPKGVSENGKVIHFAKTRFVFPDKYETTAEIVSEVRDIDTIIFCTGYSSNLEMLLDEELRSPLLNSYDKHQLPIPSDWKMKPNELTDLIGDVPPGDVRWPYHLRYPELWRGVVIDNPNMMFLEYEWFPYPLAGIDINAWMLMRIITGTFQLPSRDEMRKQNLDDALNQLQIPYVRYCVDKAFQDAYWSNANPDEKNRIYYDRAYYKTYPEYSKMYYRLAARTMEDAEYPMSYGSYEQVNELVEQCLQSSQWGYEHRSLLNQSNEDERSWMTFRDVKDAERHCSMFTGTKSVPLKGKWLESEAGDERSILE